MDLRFRLTRKRVALFIVSTALVLSGVAIGVTSNAYTDANGAYHGCVGNGSGLLRVLGDGDSCRANEAAIEWNQAGIKGDKGDKGDTGATGATGAPGTAGTNGTTGTNGLDGTNGEDGEDGEDGASVTSAIEPAGANCLNGGSRFNSVSGTTYACNGATGGGSPVYTKAQNLNGANVVVGPGFSPDTTILTINVPAGAYVVHAKVEAVNGSGSTFGISCGINQRFEGRHNTALADNTADTLHVTDVITLSAAGSITLSCGKGLGTSTSTALIRNYAMLTAVAAGTVTAVP